MNLDNFILKDDEFLNEGLIYCKKCFTPRICFSEDGEYSARCLCSCQAQKEKQKEILAIEEKKLLKISEFKKNSLLGKRYENSQFESLDLNRPQSFLNAVKRCKKFCENWHIVKESGSGIYFFGSTGTGKTELTACIANNLISKFVPVLVTNFLEISKRLRDAYSKGDITECDIIQKLVDIDLLIIDDLGAEKIVKYGDKDSFMQEKIYDIINRRYINKMPTLFTSNYSIEQLMKERGIEQRTVDRISEMSTAVIKLEGASYRRELVKENRIF